MKIQRRHLLVVIVFGGAIAGGFFLRTQQCVPSLNARTAAVENATDKDVIVFLSFAPSSVVTASSFSFCAVDGGLNCTFPLKAHETRDLPLGGKYLNLTVSFGQQGCPSTEAEMTLNNAGGYDTTDVSLVNGFTNYIEVVVDEDAGRRVLGPPRGADDNEKLDGIYPFGCDICVARQNPPCGFDAGSSGCKEGTQYDPHPPCQYQLPQKGAASVRVVLVNPPVIDSGMW